MVALLAASVSIFSFYIKIKLKTLKYLLAWELKQKEKAVIVIVAFKGT